MPNTLYKLGEITKEYTIFEDNQVLTKRQLNEVVDYFEDQTRMTRTLLLGVGLVCGLEVSHKASNNQITVGAGPAVTTDGDLLKVKAKTVFSSFKKYDDSNAKYPPFWPGGNQIPLWKLYTGKEDPPVESLNDLKNFDGDAIPIGQVAVILYLEFFPKDPDTCTTIDCDNLGSRQIARQHLLIIRKTDLDNIIQNHDTIFAQYGNDSLASNLQSWHMPRVVFNFSNTNSYTQIFKTYEKTLKSLANNLIKQLISLYDSYAKVLDPQGAIDTTIWKKRIEDLLIVDISNVGLGIQYLYDAVKDIADTYNELLKSIRALCSICCPAIDSFPKHIMLSEVVKGSQEDAPDYRHKFYPTPIHEHNKGGFEIKTLLARLNTLILNFVNPTKGQSEIRMTPSYLKCAVLGEKAIPYYYKPGKPHFAWNHQKRISGSIDENLSYHSAVYSSKEFVVNPLKFDFDEKDFLRIEGHINQDVNSALKELQQLKKRHGLAFDVIALRLNNLYEDIDYADYKCHFEDLEVLLKAWISELNCLWKDVAGFFSKFSIRDEAVHEDYKAMHVIGTDAVTENILVTGLNQKTAGTFFAQAYKSNPVVVNSVSTTKDSMGALFLQINADQPVGCPADLKDSIITNVSDGATTSGWKEESIEVAINYPAYVISNAHVLAYDQPEGILDLDEKLIKAFAKRLSGLCKRTNTFRNYASTYFKSPNYAPRGYESQYLYLLDKVSDGCCAAAKLQELFKEILKRKRSIIKQTLFSEYVQKHPGLEHTGGVPIGGTFILVYEDKAQKSNLFEEKAFRGSELTEEKRRFIGERSGVIETLERRTTVRNIFLSDAQKESFGIEEVVVVGGQPIPKFTVVADFSLPYICCSDCPPMSFIIPNVKVRLRIPDHICLADETKPIEFLVEPVGGEVTADQGGAAIVKIDGRPYFDASKLPTALHGKQIRFFVNGQETDAMTVVFRTPRPAFEFQIKTVDVEKRVAIVDFQNFTEENAGEKISYKWDFGDTKTSTERSPRHHYELPVNEKNIVEVLLFANNGPCSKKSEPVTIEFGQIGESDPGNDIRRNAELIFSRDPFELDQNRELLSETQLLYKTVVGELEANLIGENNVILENIAKVNDRTNVALRRQNPPKEQVLLGQLLMDQLYLALDILRNQKNDIPKFVNGNAGPQTTTFKFLNGMGGKLKNAKTHVPEFNHDGTITEYFETYSNELPETRPNLKSTVKRVLSVL